MIHKLAILDIGVETSGDYYDTEDDEDSYNDPTPIMPSRIVPTLVSPSFEDPASFGNIVATKVAPPKSKGCDVLGLTFWDH